MAQTKMTAIEKLLKGNLPRAVTDPYYSSLLAYALAVDGSSTFEVERLTQQLMDNATSYLEGNVYREIFPPIFIFRSFCPHCHWAFKDLANSNVSYHLSANTNLSVWIQDGTKLFASEKGQRLHGVKINQYTVIN